MKFIDVHSHLDICEDIPEIIGNCKGKDIQIVTCGVDEKTNRKTLELKKRYPELEICLGIYPLESLKMSEEKIEKEINFIRENKDKILGIGEVGLDLHSVKDTKNFEKQKRVFLKLVELAAETNKPLIVHSRDAEKETVELLESFNCKKVVMHCFSGSIKLVKRILDNGWMLSIPASVKYNEHFRRIVKTAPIDNLLCETDSPFLNPERIPEVKNNPANVLESYKSIAKIKSLSVDEAKNAVWRNYLRLEKV